MNFSFGVLTYNSSEFIIELLESIKYQILNYGEDFSIDLIIADDFSSDNTVDLINLWCKDSANLFRKIKVIKNTCNKGIAYNYCVLIENIETEYFIKIDGDDLLSSGNIFDKCFGFGRNECRVYFPIRFNDDAYFEEQDLINTIFYSNRKHDHNIDFKLVRTIKPFMTPQVVISHSNFNNECLDFVKRFSVFEDDTSIYSIFKNNSNMVLRFFSEPLVLYRVHKKSISNGLENYHQIKFMDDLHNYRKILIKNERNLLLILYLFLACVDSFLRKHRFSSNNSFLIKLEKYLFNKRKNKALSYNNYQSYVKNFNEVVIKENKHIRFLIEKAQDFKKRIIS